MEDPEFRGWRAAYQAGMRAGSDACPDDETLAALVLGELRGDERERLAVHVTECRRCAASYRTLRAVHAEARHGPAGRRRMRWPAVAAAAVVAAGLGVSLVWLARDSPSTRTDETVRGSAPLEERVRPVADAVLETPPAHLSWPAQVGATGYRVRLYDETASVLWKGSRVVEPRIVVEDEAQAALVAGGAYFWTVDVEGPVTRSRLGPFWFRIGG